MDLRGNPFLYTTRTDIDETLTKHEFDKILLKLELKRIENKSKQIKQKNKGGEQSE